MDNETELKEIVNHEILYGSFYRDLGLLNGKMGVVLFLYHYARYTKQVLYDDFAGEILQEVLDTVHEGLPIHFSDGLCGIAWGIAYLIRQNFVEGDSEDVLKDMDNKIMEHDPRRITDCTFETGLKGIAYYISYRQEHTAGNMEIFDPIYRKEVNTHLLRQGYKITMPSEKDILYMMAHSGKKETLSWKRGLEILQERMEENA